MVVPLGNGGLVEEVPPPDSVKSRFSKWWWCLTILYIAVCVGRIIAKDIFGALLTGIMGGITYYMVTNDCAKMSQYCILLFGFMCCMNSLLEFVTLAGALSGREMRRTSSQPATSMNGGGSATTYTITIEKHPFFDNSAGWSYNQQSAMMIICPAAAALGALLAYASYNAFPSSLFSDEGGGGGEAQNFGGGRLGGYQGYNAGDYSAPTGGGRAVQTGARQSSAALFQGSGQRLGS
mmetsp:Transcript_56325/g.89448  ORF Transcript_56325/g.89448 Transcript_56325/m.89448 type:complete len:236 (+) Transcript_56325:74-781(+)